MGPILNPGDGKILVGCFIVVCLLLLLGGMTIGSCLQSCESRYEIKIEKRDKR